MPKKQKNVNLRAVAARANVTVATASLALRGIPRIKEETRQRVLQAAEELNYRPNPYVGVLMRGIRSGAPPNMAPTIAYVSTYAAGEGDKYWLEAYREGARERAHRFGFRLEEFDFVEEMRPERFRQILDARNIRCAIWGPLNHKLRNFEWNVEGLAIAQIGNDPMLPHFHRARGDFRQGMVKAINRLIELGYRRIGYPADPVVDAHSDYGFRLGMLLEQNLAAGRTDVELECLSLEDEELVSWCRQRSGKGALLSPAAWPLHLLSQLGMKCPHDFGFALIHHAGRGNKCAGISLDFERIGAAAVDLVLEQTYANESGIPEKSKVVVIEPDWVDGETVRVRARRKSQTNTKK